MLLADNDVLAKAAHWGLLECVPQIVAGDWADVAALSSLRHRARRAATGKSDRLFASPDVARDLAQVLERTQDAPLAAEAIRAMLSTQIGIDPGEQILFAALIERSDTHLLTGDKRALIALADSASDATLHALTGRCFCTEQLIAHAIQQYGLDNVQARVRKHVARDLTLRIIMGSDASKLTDEVSAGLASYIADIRLLGRGLLSPLYG